MLYKEEPHWCLHIELKFKWYDAWVGIFIDRKTRDLYLSLIPMLVLKIYIQEEGRMAGRTKKCGLLEKILRAIGKECAFV